MSHDERVAWLQQKAVRLRSIDPHDEDFSDLEPFGQAIGSVRVVMLGEASHGDGATFHAKTRLVKYLHQHLGFDVLAFESGFYNCAKAWQSFLVGENTVKAFQRGVFGVWSKSAQVVALMEHIAQNAQAEFPLQLVGVDSQFTAFVSNPEFAVELEAFFAKLGGPDLQHPDWQDFKTVLHNHLTWQEGVVYSSEVQQTFFARLKQLISMLESSESKDPQGKVWLQHLRNMEAEAEREFAQSDETFYFNRRDEQMARNLQWWLEHFQNRKIIVWAANVHIARNTDLIEQEPFGKVLDRIPMGHHVWQNLGEDVYSIGMTSFDGWTGYYRMEPYEVSPPQPGDLEDLFFHAGFEQGFLNLRDDASWLHEPLTAKPFGHSRLTSNWPNHFDGMLFIRTMTPARPIVAAPTT